MVSLGNFIDYRSTGITRREEYMLNKGLVLDRFVLPEKNKDRLTEIDRLGVGRRMKIDVEENRFQ